MNNRSYDILLDQRNKLFEIPGRNPGCHRNSSLVLCY